MSDPTDPASYSGYADQPTDPQWAPAPAPPASPASPSWPPATPGYPPAPAPATAYPGEPVLIVIGDMSITQFHVITPNGTYPLNRTNWFVTDHSTYSQGTPTYAVVLAIITFFFVCFFGLLFLLIKEQQAQGFVQVTVQGNGWSHVTQLPAGTAASVHHQVAYVQNLVATLG